MSTTTPESDSYTDTTDQSGEELADKPELAGYLAEFDNVDSILDAAEKVRDAGYRLWDVHSPFPVHGMDDAMGIRPTILPWLVFIGGLVGLIAGILMQWWMNAYDYPYLISGKPIWSFPANVPVAFECTIAGAAFTAVFGMLMLNKLPMHYNPLLKSERFRQVTNDKFFVVIDAMDPQFDEAETLTFLQSLRPTIVERFED